MIPHRVVLGLDAGIPPRESLEAAAALAAQLDAELVGLFIEDLDLLRFAALPFAQEIGFASASRRQVDVGAVERALRARAAEARRALASTAERVRIRWSFRVARGFTAGELVGEAMGHGIGAALRRETRLLLLGAAGSAALRWAEDACAHPGAGLLRLQVIRAADLAELAEALRAGTEGVVVLQGDQAVLSERRLQTLLQEARAPVLIPPTRGGR